MQSAKQSHNIAKKHGRVYPPRSGGPRLSQSSREDDAKHDNPHRTPAPSSIDLPVSDVKSNLTLVSQTHFVDGCMSFLLDVNNEQTHNRQGYKICPQNESCKVLSVLNDSTKCAATQTVIKSVQMVQESRSEYDLDDNAKTKQTSEVSDKPLTSSSDSAGFQDFKVMKIKKSEQRKDESLEQRIIKRSLPEGAFERDKLKRPLYQVVGFMEDYAEFSSEWSEVEESRRYTPSVLESTVDGSVITGARRSYGPRLTSGEFNSAINSAITMGSIDQDPLITLDEWGMKTEQHKYKCSDCDEVSRRRTDIEEHIASLLPDSHEEAVVIVLMGSQARGRNCPLCNVRLQRKDLFKHIRDAHGALFPIRCGYCVFMGQDYNQVRQHIRLKHGTTNYHIINLRLGESDQSGNKSIAPTHGTESEEEQEDQELLRAGTVFCPVCRKVLKNLRNLKKHITQHSSIKVQCALCSFTASFPAQIRSHCIRKHPSKTPKWQKVVVDKQENDGLVEDITPYLQMVTEKYGVRQPKKEGKWRRQYRCPYCDYTCNFNSSYNRHIRIHSGIKAFKCGHCDFYGREAYVVRKHCFKAHKGKEAVVENNHDLKVPYRYASKMKKDNYDGVHFSAEKDLNPVGFKGCMKRLQKEIKKEPFQDDISKVGDNMKTHEVATNENDGHVSVRDNVKVCLDASETTVTDNRCLANDASCTTGKSSLSAQNISLIIQKYSERNVNTVKGSKIIVNPSKTSCKEHEEITVVTDLAKQRVSGDENYTHFSKGSKSTYPLKNNTLTVVTNKSMEKSLYRHSESPDVRIQRSENVDQTSDTVQYVITQTKNGLSYCSKTPSAEINEGNGGLVVIELSSVGKANFCLDKVARYDFHESTQQDCAMVNQVFPEVCASNSSVKSQFSLPVAISVKSEPMNDRRMEGIENNFGQVKKIVCRKNRESIEKHSNETTEQISKDSSLGNIKKDTGEFIVGSQGLENNLHTHIAFLTDSLVQRLSNRISATPGVMTRDLLGLDYSNSDYFCSEKVRLMMKEKKDGKVKCRECGATTTYRAFYKHAKKHFHIKPFKCGYCSYRSIEKSKIRVHNTFCHPSSPCIILKLSPETAAVSPSVPSQSDESGPTSQVSVDIEKSQSSNNSGKSEACLSKDHLGSNFVESISRPTKAVYNPLNNSATQLTSTILEVSSTQRQSSFQCPLCLKLLQHHMPSVRRHLYSHFGYKPYKCGYCSFTAIGQNEVRAHHVTHGFKTIPKVEPSGNQMPPELTPYINLLSQQRCGRKSQKKRGYQVGQSETTQPLRKTQNLSQAFSWTQSAKNCSEEIGTLSLTQQQDESEQGMMTTGKPPAELGLSSEGCSLTQSLDSVDLSSEAAFAVQVLEAGQNSESLSINPPLSMW